MTREEAIDRLRQIYADANDETKAALGALIPELAESEDERIRKIIADSVFYHYGEGVEYQEVLAYLDELEKRKEQEPAECVPDSVKFDEGFKTGREIGFREGAESVKPAESDAIKGGDFISDGKRVFLVLANVKERNLGETGSTFCEGLILGVDGAVYCDGGRL